MARRKWPSWWAWELELSPHLLKRMINRRFTEVDVRRMLENATGLREDVVVGRWIVETRHTHAAWEVIVEPDLVQELVVVITAYRVQP